MKKYIRTTHCNHCGEYLELVHGSKESQKAWHDQYYETGFVGHMLDSKNAMSFKELKKAIHKYNKDFDEPLLGDLDIRIALDLLIENKFAAEIEE